MFRENQLRYDDPGRLKAYENFKRNLEDILGEGEKAGVPVILSTVASNLRDCSPFASLHSVQLGKELLSWDRLYQNGLKLQEAGSYAAALEAYLKAAAIDAEFAELQYRIGTCHLALGDAQFRQSFQPASQLWRNRRRDQPPRFMFHMFYNAVASTQPIGEWNNTDLVTTQLPKKGVVQRRHNDVEKCQQHLTHPK